MKIMTSVVTVSGRNATSHSKFTAAEQRQRKVRNVHHHVQEPVTQYGQSYDQCTSEIF